MSTFGDPSQQFMGDAGLSQQLASIYGPLFAQQLAQPLAQQDYTNQLAQQQFANTGTSLGIQRGALARQQQALPREQSLANQLLGLQGDELGIQREQLGLRGKSLDITEGTEREAAERARRGEWSSATARGATITSGHNQALTDIQTQLQQQLAQLGLSRQGLGLQGKELGIQGSRLGIERQQSDIGYGLQSGSLADQLAYLNLYGTENQQNLQNALQGSAIQAQQGTTNAALGQANTIGQYATAVPGGGPSPAYLGPPQQAPPPRQTPYGQGATTYQGGGL